MKKLIVSGFLFIFFAVGCNPGGSVESKVNKLIKDRQFRKAESLILEQEETSGLSPKYRILLAKVYFSWGKYTKALKTLYSMNKDIYGKTKKNYINLLLVTTCRNCSEAT